MFAYSKRMAAMAAGCAMVAACGLGFGLWGTTASSQATAQIAEEGLCLNGFSKNICEGSLTDGSSTRTVCSSLPGCETLTRKDAKLFAAFKHNDASCQPIGPFFAPCDEVREQDGKLTVSVDILLRLHRPCPLRGCIEGDGQYETEDGRVYNGMLMGTLGVGSHRANRCDEYARDCESCVDVEYIPSATGEPGTWRIGMEAAFHGQSPRDPNDRICFTISGNFYLPGDASGPFDLTGPMRFVATADGVAISGCF